MELTSIVSVVIPTHNRAKLLVRSVESVLRQTFSDLECIVVDDASSDSTPGVVAEIMRKDSRVKYCRHEKNRYAAGARNTGISMASGKFIAFHDDDDEWLPTKLEKQLALFSKLPIDYGCVYCWADGVDGRGNIILQHRPSIRGDGFAKTLVKNAIGCTPSLLIRRDIIEQIGPWNENLRTEEDNEYIIRLCRIAKVDFVPEVLVRVHATDEGPRNSMPVGREGLQLYLEAAEARYALFEKNQRQYPRQAAALKALMGNLHVRLNNTRAGIGCFLQAFSMAPLSRDPSFMLLSVIKWLLFGGYKKSK